MRKKLILVILLFFTIILTLVNNSRRNVIVTNPERISIISDADFEENEDLILNRFQEGSQELEDIVLKYEFVDGSQLRACDIDATATLITRVNNYNVIVLEENGRYEYFRQFNNNTCELIGSIEDVNFTENIDEAYANNSIYTSFVSNSDFAISGMVRINNEEVTPFDTLDRHFINPVAFNDGVLMILNKRDIVAFDNNNELLFTQDNSANNRNVVSMSVVRNNIIAIVDIDDRYYIEAYNLDDIESIENAQSLVSLDITDYMGRVGSEVSTIIGDNYTSFTTMDNTIVVSRDLSKVIVLNNFNTALGFSGDTFIARRNEGYYWFDLNSQTSAALGNVKVLNFRIVDRSIIFEILAIDGTRDYIKFTRR